MLSLFKYPVHHLKFFCLLVFALCQVFALYAGSSALGWISAPSDSDALTSWYRGWEALANDQYSAALTYFLAAAKNGRADASFEIGVMYDFGAGVKKDPVTADNWYKAASEAGSSLGTRSLALSYLAGSGVPKDVPKAIELLGKATSQGESDAALELAIIYQTGRGVERSERDAKSWKAQMNRILDQGLTVCRRKDVEEEMAELESAMRQKAGLGLTLLGAPCANCDFSRRMVYDKVVSMAIIKSHGVEPEVECAATFDQGPQWTFKVNQVTRNGVTQFWVTRATVVQQSILIQAGMQPQPDGHMLGLHDLFH